MSAYPTVDEMRGIAWWNGLTIAERAHWLEVAFARTRIASSPADAWAEFKRQRPEPITHAG